MSAQLSPHKPLQKLLLSSAVFVLGFFLGGIPASRAGSLYVTVDNLYTTPDSSQTRNGGNPDGFYSNSTSGFYSEYGRYNSCVGEACSRGGFSCSLESDLNKVIRLCRYAGSQCVSVACDESDDCGTEGGLEKVVSACQGVDGTCVKDACDASDDCGLDDDLLRIIGMCRAY